MNHEMEALEKRIGRLERQNRHLKWLGFVLLALATTTAASGDKNVVLQGQKFELRDSAGQLRADLAILNGDPVLSFYDENGRNQGFVDGDQFTIFKKGGGEADIQATFGAHGLSFEGGHDKVFVSLRADEEEQTGKLQLNDYHHKTFAGVTPADLSKLHPDKTR